MSDLNLYWAEEALGEPYRAQDYNWLKSTRRAGLMLGGATCALTATVLLGGASYYLMDRSPRVAISSYEIEAVAAASPTVPPPPPPAFIPKLISAAPASSPEPSTAEARPHLTLSHERAPTNAPPATAALPKPAAVARAAGPTPAAEKALPLVMATALEKAAPVNGPEAAPVAKTESDARMGLSKSAESKTADIASGEKLGIREILPDGIVMQNGRKVKNGAALPNGEILIGTDVAKGMAETDRRILVLTP